MPSRENGRTLVNRHGSSESPGVELGLGAYQRALFVYHRGTVRNDRHPHIELVDATRLASMVLDAGLTRWLLRRVR